MLPILQRAFWSIFIWGWGEECSYSRVSGLGGVPPLFLVYFCFCFFGAVQSKRTSQDTKHYLTNFAGVSAQEEPPVPRNLPINFIESSVPHKPTNKQTNKESNLQKELEAGPFSWVYILGNKSASWGGCFLRTFATTTKKKNPCSTDFVF
jgi:hypothetical protein